MGEQDEVREYHAVDTTMHKDRCFAFLFIKMAEWGGTGTSPVIFVLMIIRKRQVKTVRKS